MASHLVSQHQLSSYASPDNGQAGDATVVLGNDNTTVTGYNSHDSDGTIHVQDSSAAVFGAIPAGTQGRKWMTNDTGAIYFYYDNGSAWVEFNYLRNTGGTVTGAVTITSTSASALAVGRQGATDPVLKVNANTASVATGIEIVGAAAAGGVNVRAISSGTDENLTVNAKGAGTITLGSASTGAITLTRATTASSTLTVTSTLTLKDGTAGAPSAVFSSDTTTGIYRSSLGVIGFAISGGGAATLSATAFTLGSGVALSAQSVTVASGQTLTLTGATVTGLTAASVGAGTFPSGAFVFQGAVSGVTTLSGSAQFSNTTAGGGTAAGLYVNSTAPALALRESDAAVDNRTWDMIANGTTLSIRAVDDANSVATNLLSFARSGTTAGTATFGAGVAATTWTGTGLIQTTLTTEQMRLRYDSTHYIKHTVDSSGNITYDAIGAGGIGYYFQVAGASVASFTSQGFTVAVPMGTFPSAAAASGFNIPHGTAPTSPNNGDIWTTTGGMFVRINGVTKSVNLT